MLQIIKIIFILSIITQTYSYGQKYDFEFPKNIISEKGITKLIIQESRPKHQNLKGEKIFHSEYEFYNNGIVKSLTYLPNCGNDKIHLRCLAKDIFKYTPETKLMCKTSFVPKRKIRYNPNRPLKSNNKLLKKLKKVQWQQLSFIECYKYDAKGNILVSSIRTNTSSNEVKLFEYKYEYRNDQLVKKYSLNIEKDTFEIMDSISISDKTKTIYSFIDGEIISKTIFLDNSNDSKQKQIYTKENNEYQLSREITYDTKNRIALEIQGSYITEFQYNELGLLKKVTEKMNNGNYVSRILHFEYQ